MAFFQKQENPSYGGGKEASQIGIPVTLSELYAKVEEAQNQIAKYLLNREAELYDGATKTAGMSRDSVSAMPVDKRQFSEMLLPVIERLDAIGEMLAARVENHFSSESKSSDVELYHMLTERFNRLEGFLKGNPSEVSYGEETDSSAEERPLNNQQFSDTEDSRRDFSHYKVREEFHGSENHGHPEPKVFSSPVSGFSGRGKENWAEAVLGKTLANNPVLASECRALLNGILQGDVNSRYFAGVLMMFQASPAEKMVLLLKDLGEAYYRWAPKRDMQPVAMEVALKEFAQQMCDSVGLSNMIELVHPGQRFDSSRHNATSRGIEVTQVLGWVVLRGNGSVYAKATVGVQ
ncbi:MAG: hypothetical protein Q4C96_06950 [Planctomycetia bacterium]|nr:hypothetical protein [Planctomycetia bacterium]